MRDYLTKAIEPRFETKDSGGFVVAIDGHRSSPQRIEEEFKRSTGGRIEHKSKWTREKIDAANRKARMRTMMEQMNSRHRRLGLIR